MARVSHQGRGIKPWQVHFQRAVINDLNEKIPRSFVKKGEIRLKARRNDFNFNPAKGAISRRSIYFDTENILFLRAFANTQDDPILSQIAKRCIKI